MSHIILTGATGTAGSAILSYCLSSPAISKVTILSRRPVKLAEGHEKANVIIQTDYNTYPPDILAKAAGATGCIWAQGTASAGFKEKDYTVITYDYPMSALKAFSTLSPNFKFIYISGEGADPSECSPIMFAKIKGRAEKDLLALTTQDEYKSRGLKVYNLRPAFIDPEDNFLGDRSRTFKEKFGDFAAPLFRRALPSLVMPTKTLAKATVELVTGDGEPFPDEKGTSAGGWTLDNNFLRRMGASEEAKASVEKMKEGTSKGCRFTGSSGTETKKSS